MLPLLRRSYSKARHDFFPSSSVKVFRIAKTTANSTNHKPKPAKIVPLETNKDEATNDEYAENLVKVQMISRNLHQQLFAGQRRLSKSTDANEKETSAAQRHIAELRRHNIDLDSTERIADVHLKLPPLRGENIEQHFYAIAKEQVAPYEQLLQEIVSCAETALPAPPSNWLFRVGWTVYDPCTGEASASPIEYPGEDALIFDVEVCVAEGGQPTLATAVGARHWYSWVSPQLINSNEKSSSEPSLRRRNYSIDDLIPLGARGPKIIVGHNVSYDRARVREQYNLAEDTRARFLDTMSLHVCVSGVTSYQRAMLKSKKPTAPEDEEWREHASLNSLTEVHRLYCGGEPLNKEARNVFVEGTLADVRSDFQRLMSYCAGDVLATRRVLRVIYPLYTKRFPHPATLVGMLEMGSAFLPVNSNWQRYIREADLAFEDLSIETKYHLARRADKACSLLKEEQYRKHLWLWDEDWSVQKLKLKKLTVRKSNVKGNVAKGSPVTENTTPEQKKEENNEEYRLLSKFQYLYDLKKQLPVRRPLLPGYPAWYRKLCQKPPSLSLPCNWAPGATEIGTGMQIAPKLLSLCWEGYPLHYLKGHGWGFLVPFREQHPSESPFINDPLIPIEQLSMRCPVPEFVRDCATEEESDYAFSILSGEVESRLSRRDYYTKAKKKNKDNSVADKYKGSGVWCNQLLEECCFFFKLPHKNGVSFRVGNPLSRDFLNKFSENVLSSGDSESGSAARVIQIARMMSYWRNNRDRILSQMVVWLPAAGLPDKMRSSAMMPTDGADLALQYGAICPQVVACGTLTRRAMEPTWMTAANSQRERIGSELRAMVQAPPSYKIVGADVDSQELWIASVLGDAYACGVHGATPLGWMTLSGAKSNGTDMHSITAKAVGISRDHAKVINYARIYGAGQNFAERLLKQFNPTFSDTEAKTKAMKMFAITKGKRVYRLRKEFQDQYEDKNFSGYEALKTASACNRAVNEMFESPRWVGGTESAMFNRLEEIASGENPVTPFLGCRLSRALEAGNTGNENRFLPTRVNWVVQSGAVDFLHLMLVSMRWLMGPNVRFCLSFHDELRYLVKDEMAYKAALAMHITNLLTRAFCASRIGLTDLPMSVAFFASVEVDTVLRKESTMDCVTPSNPHGLRIGYGIPAGESLNIYEAIEKAGGNDISQWEWLK